MDAGLVQVLKDYYDQQFNYADDDPNAFNDHSEVYLFYNPKTGKPMYDISQSWKKATSKANLEGLHRHDLRHVFCTKMVEKANVDVLVLADLLGHSSPKMVMKYRHTSNHHYANFVQQMADSLFKNEPVSLGGSGPSMT
jgi:integrase